MSRAAAFLVGFTGVNKSRTCARPRSLTPEIDASLMGVSFSWRPGPGQQRSHCSEARGKASALPIKSAEGKGEGAAAMTER